jgi:hypothetical protein
LPSTLSSRILTGPGSSSIGNRQVTGLGQGNEFRSSKAEIASSALHDYTEHPSSGAAWINH